jgi:hypothetical protein
MNASKTAVRVCNGRGRELRGLFVVIDAQDSPGLGVDQMDPRTRKTVHRLVDFVIGSSWVIRNPALNSQAHNGAGVEERGHA